MNFFSGSNIKTTILFIGLNIELHKKKNHTDIEDRKISFIGNSFIHNIIK